MMHLENYQSNIPKGQGMSVFALRVLAPGINYDELNTVFSLKFRNKLSGGVESKQLSYQRFINQ